MKCPPPPRETILAALHARLSALPASALRGDVLPERVPSPVRPHPNLSELYRRKVGQLAATLADATIRTEALTVIRGLIKRVTVFQTAAGITLELDGALTAMLALAQNAEDKPVAELAEVARSVKVVAGAGFEPAAFRL